ncbi:MAG: hypothetical protein ACRDN0_20665 [Trebonia sp.]
MNTILTLQGMNAEKPGVNYGQMNSAYSSAWHLNVAKQVDVRK